MKHPWAPRIYPNDIIMPKRGGGEKRVPAAKVLIDRSTGHGEDAELYERMPHNGRRWIDRRKIIRMEPAQ